MKTRSVTHYIIVTVRVKNTASLALLLKSLRTAILIA